MTRRSVRVVRLLMLPMLSEALVYTAGRTCAVPHPVCSSRLAERHHCRVPHEAVVMASRFRVRERVRGWVSKRIRFTEQVAVNERNASGAVLQEMQQTSAGHSSAERVNDSPIAEAHAVHSGEGQEISKSIPASADEMHADGNAAADRVPVAESAPVAMAPRVDSLPSLDQLSFGSRGSQGPSILDPDVCLLPGVPVVRVENAPGNARRIFTGVDIVADCGDVLDVVWAVLNDYPRLAEAVPNLVENEVVGAAKLAPMLTFKAMTTLDAVPYPDGLPPAMEAEHLDETSATPSELEAGLPLRWGIFPRPYCIGSLPHRDITMQGVKGEGDFHFYQGVWRLQPLPNCAPPGMSAMRLTYSVELSPRAWVPVALLEGQIAKTLGENLMSVREYVVQPRVIREYSAAPAAAVARG